MATSGINYNSNIVPPRYRLPLDPDYVLQGWRGRLCARVSEHKSKGSAAKKLPIAHPENPLASVSSTEASILGPLGLVNLRPSTCATESQQSMDLSHRESLIDKYKHLVSKAGYTNADGGRPARVGESNLTSS